MDPSAPSPWDKCTGILQKFLSADVYRERIAPLRPLEFTQTALVLEVPSSIPIDPLRKGFQGLLEHAAEQATGFAPRITFVPSQGSSLPRGAPRLPAVEMNPRFTFDTFVVGGNSQFAHSAARAVAEAPGRTRFNPLMIYGGSGLGKTHLLQAIGQHIRRQFPEVRVRYVPTEDFMNEYIQYLQKNKVNEFASFYRNEIDVLLMDDIQALVGRDALQQEFFHLFNTFHQSSRQIVLTSDCPPGDLKGLEDRLVSRFQWGLSVDIQPPDRDTREAILRNKAQEENLDLSEEIISYVAETVDTNIRVMEGIVRRLILEASMDRNEITVELAQRVVEAQVHKPGSRRFPPGEILRVVADFFGVEVDSLLREGRGAKEVARARQVAMYLIKQLTELSLKSIGAHFGGRDHTTVIHAVRTTERSMRESAAARQEIEQLLKVLR